MRVEDEGGYLTLPPESSLLQPGPDALDASGMFWVCVGAATHALVLLHEGVIHQTWNTHTHTHVRT